MSAVVNRIVVKTQTGRVEGLVTGGVASFKGLPFAAPPFGPHRFQPPQPVEPWTGVRDARAYGQVVPQSPYPEPFRSLLGDAGESGEDCLNLNVWTPEPIGQGLPVMVWIHGGAFLKGSGAIAVYDGSRFARDGVVCLTINYRLGADGFLWLGDGVANLGLLDQVAALRWVQENIEAFGGDPTRVTIFGESAGAFSVATLIAMRRASGLFQRAILQSGAGHHVISTDTAALIGRELCQTLGVPATREALAAVPISRFVAAQAELAAELATRPDPTRWGEVAANGMLFEPVIDGDVVGDRPINAIAAGTGAGLELLIGTTAEEWRFFMVPSGAIDRLTETHLQWLAARRGLDPASALPTYRAAQPAATPGDLVAAMVTDWFFRIPAIRLGEAQARNGGAAFLYEFAWRSPLYDGRLGACHALEIPFVFDNLDPTTSPMTGERPPQALAGDMHRGWVAFAATGNPGWPRYDPAQRQVMRFDANARALVSDPDAATRRLWDGVR